MALAAAGAVGLVALHLRTPYDGGAWGTCPVLLLTGFACPGCGGLRAAHDLSHGDLAAAVASNAWVVLVVLPLALAFWARWLRRGVRRAPRTRLARADLLLWGAVALTGLVFAVLRNTPVGATLAP